MSHHQPQWACESSGTHKSWFKFPPCALQKCLNQITRFHDQNQSGDSTKWVPPYKQTWQEQDHAKSEHQIGSIIVRKIDIVCLRPLITDIDMCSSWTYTEPIYAYIEYIHTYLYIHILQYINKYWTCKSKCIYLYMS